jgi:hypothetical protein
VFACSSDPAPADPVSDAGAATDAGSSPSTDGAAVVPTDGGSSGTPVTGDASAADAGDDATADAGTFPINFFAKGTCTFTSQGTACEFSFSGTGTGDTPAGTQTEFRLTMATPYAGQTVVLVCNLTGNKFTCAPVNGSQMVGACNVTAGITEVAGTLTPVVGSANQKASATISAKVGRMASGPSPSCNSLACPAGTISGTAIIK